MALLSTADGAFCAQMKKYIFLFLATAMAASAAELPVKIFVLDSTVLCVRASRVPEDVTDQIRAASVPSHLAGTVLDLRFANGAATNAADYFVHRKSPLVVLVNGQTRGAAATLAAQLRTSASAVLIGNTNSPVNLSPDIVVSVGADDEKKFQDNPFFKAAGSPTAGLSATNGLLAFVDHTSEADLVRKHVKDGEEDGDVASPRAEPPQPVIRDPALARAVDLLKALAALHPARG
jgi:hypothetical protein